jgi:PAS domain S-box-containing protein
LGQERRQPDTDATPHAPGVPAWRVRATPPPGPLASAAALLTSVGTTTIGMVMTDPDGRFLWVNPAFSRITGYSTSELARMTFFDLTHPDDIPRIRDEVDRALADAHVSFVIEKRCVTKSGGWVWTRNNITLIRDGDGQPVHFVSIIEDVTTRVRSARGTRRLEHVAAALASAITPDDVASVIVEHAIAAIGAAAGVIYRLCDDGTTLELVRAVGYPVDEIARWKHVATDAALPLADAARSGESIFLESKADWKARYGDSDPLRAFPEGRAWAALPLIAEGRVLGAIGVSFKKRRHPAPAGATRFDNDTRAFMLALVQQCGQALERARLYEAERRARADAEAARADAEAANAAKNEFLAAMSHEIRTPINAIQGYAQLLELGLAGPVTEYQRTYLGRLASSSHHLLGLVDDVLDLAKVDAGEMKVALDLADTGPAVDTALDVTRPLAAARGVRIVDDRPNGSRVSFVGDEHRVRQILINLLSNAIKFTNGGGTVTVQSGTRVEADPRARLRGRGPWAFIRVEDTGIGIAAEDHGRVFEAFHQLDRGPTRTHGGTGLGLTISRRLARLQGGDLCLESTLGTGSVFTVWLPATEISSDGATESAETRAARLKRADAVLGVPGLSDLGEFLLRESDHLREVYVDRMRADPLIPGAKRLGTAPLEDHAVTLLADFAQTLMIIGEAGPDAAGLLRDGSAIQCVVAETHGVRRFASGWSVDAVRRDLEILREILTNAVRARARDTATNDADAVAVLFHLVDRAAAISRRAWHRAAHGPAPAAADAPEIADIPASVSATGAADEDRA